MSLDQLIAFCESLPGAEALLKIGHHLTYNVGNKTFIWISQDLSPVPCDFKCTEEDFYELSERDGFDPAPYIGRYGWIRCQNIELLTQEDADKFIRRSYNLIWDKLSTKIRAQLMKKSDH